MSITNEYKFDDIAEKAIAYGLKKGASDVELGLEYSSGFSVNARKGVVEQVEHDKGKSFDVTLLMGQRSGSASTTDLSWPAVKNTIDAAFNIAKHITEDKFLSMPDREKLAFDYPDLSLSHPAPISIEQAIECAIECEASALEHDDKIVNSEGAGISSHHSVNYLANSLGFQGDYESTNHDLSCVVIAKQGDEMQRDYAFTCGRDWGQLKATHDIGKLAASNALQRLGARPIKTELLPIIFSARCSRVLVSCLLSAISGSAIYKKSSFLLDKLGEKILPEFFNVVEKPFIKGGLGSAPFDGEGVRPIEKSIVNQGVLSTYLLSSYSANQLGMTTTGNCGGVFNIHVDTNAQDENELMAKVNKGLIVTEYMGSGIDIVNGVLSLGVVGHYFERGNIVHAVSEVTVAGNLADIFQKILAVAADDLGNSSIQMGALLVESMMVAGQ